MSSSADEANYVNFDGLYHGQLPDGTLCAVKGEIDPTLLFTGEDSRAAQAGRSDKSTSLAVVMRLHETGILGNDPVARRILREVHDSEWEITAEVPRRGLPYSDEDMARSEQRTFDLEGVCPHMHAAAFSVERAEVVEVIAVQTNAGKDQAVIQL
jgi:cytosine/adenosine deaminase-related metal-dependent hydrolase